MKLNVFNVDMKLTFHECTIRECEMKGGELFFTLACDHVFSSDKSCDAFSVFIRDLEIDKEYEHVEILRTKKGRIRELSFGEFAQILKEEQLAVEMDYYSYCAKGMSLILHGAMGVKYYVFISEIEKIVLYRKQKKIDCYKMNWQ